MVELLATLIVIYLFILLLPAILSLALIAGGIWLIFAHPMIGLPLAAFIAYVVWKDKQRWKIPARPSSQSLEDEIFHSR